MAIIGLCIGDGQDQSQFERFKDGSGGLFIEELEKFGHEIVDYRDPSCQYFLSLDHRKFSFNFAKRIFPKNKRILFVQEPFVVIPSNYKSRIRMHYGLTLSLSPFKADYWFPWPQYPWGGDVNIDNSLSQIPREYTAVLINSNKVSLLSGSLYGFRRKIVKYLGNQHFPLILCGPNWDRKPIHTFIENIKSFAYAILNFRLPVISEFATTLKFPSSTTVMGVIPNKTEIMRQSVFALVIENQNNYVSEKLFDALFAGCVPIYVGPKLEDFGIPSDIAIQLPPKSHQIYKALVGLSDSEIETIRENGRRWIALESTRNTWSAEFAYKPIVEQVNSWIIQNN